MHLRNTLNARVECKGVCAYQIGTPLYVTCYHKDYDYR